MANKMQNDFYGFNLNWCYTDLQLGVFDAGNPSGQPIGNKGGNTWAGSFNAHTFSYNSHGIANGWLMPQTTTTTGNANTPVESEYPLNMVNGVFNSPGVPMVFPLKPYDQINYPTADAGCNTAQSIQNSNGNTNFNKERAREVAIGVPHFIGLSDGGIWNEKVKLHQSIVHNPTIISGDVILTNFADEFAGSVTAELIRISRESILAKKDAVKKADLKAELQNLILIEEKDIKLAKTVEANLILESASNNLESLSYKSLNDSAATQTIDTLVLLAELREIAALCPYEYGLAVYSARAILFNWDQSIYNNICEDGYIANDSVSTSKIAAPTGFNKEANNNFSFANNGIKIYPNPAKEQVSLWINEKQNLEIIDMLGKLVYYAELEGGVSEIEIKEFSEGIYLLKLENFNKEITYGKLVIKR